MLNQKDIQLLEKIGKQLGDLKRDLVAEQEFTDQRFTDVWQKLKLMGLPSGQSIEIKDIVLGDPLTLIKRDLPPVITKIDGVRVGQGVPDFEIQLQFYHDSLEADNLKFQQELAASIAPLLSKFKVKSGKIEIRKI